ncbi:MAG: hypothetical protein QOH90_480 [Actinomycetota bacterium]|nr:hypothetical protein [Actinomycetota bacterium]
MKFSVEAWATEYGTPMEAEMLELSEGKTDLTVEFPIDKWAPLTLAPETTLPQKILFTDGVRRIDARLWIETPEGRARPAVCASYAAGAICCDGRAEVVHSTVERGMFSAVSDASEVASRHATYGVRSAEGDAPEQLWLAIQLRMGMLETEIAMREAAELTIVDGPLKASVTVPRAVGYIKTHHVAYLPPEVEGVIARLTPGSRTPLFLTLGRWGRYSWYVRLPGGEGHSWAGVVRCEVSADSDVEEVKRLADSVTAALPKFASQAHKDPRAPQNLYPIAGLERELRRRLGDPALLFRSLKIAASENSKN